jgi:phage terminase large subunit-like protein
VKESGDDQYSYKNMLSREEANSVNSFLYKSILELCYDKKDGMYYFCKFILGDLTDVGYPKPFRYNRLLRKWDKLVKEFKKLAIQCARGHGKSVFFTQVLSIYDLFLFKYRKIIIVSSNQDQANRLLDELKIIIENNEWLATKRNMNRWASSTIGYNGGTVIAAGVGSEILGQHVDRIVMDDILRSDNKLTDEEIEDYVDMTLDPMLLNRDGQMILVGTPKRESDIFAAINTRKKLDPACPWEIKSYPAVLDYEKKILQCLDRFSWDEIMEKRLSMGPLKFSREYQLEFFSRDTSIFPSRIINPAKEKGKDTYLLEFADKRPPNWMFVIGVDVARSGSVSADYTVAIVLAYDTVSQSKQIIHMWRERGLKINEQSKQIAELSRRFNNCLVVVETNNMGQDMVDVLVDEYNVFVEPVTVGGSAKKEELIRFLVTSFENEQMVIPVGDDYSREQMQVLESELSKYCVTITPKGNERFEGVGSHDDCVSALALANKGTQIGGVPFAVVGSGNRGNAFSAFTDKFDRNESDLVKQIKMGLIR